MPFAMAVARGLEELHSRDIIAADLKPDNILLTDTGHAVIADFGISRIVRATVGNVTVTSAQGTDNYMAPEQFRSRQGEHGVSVKSDIWAFACTFIHMLTGQAPMHGQDRHQIFRRVSLTVEHSDRLPKTWSFVHFTTSIIHPISETATSNAMEQDIVTGREGIMKLALSYLTALLNVNIGCKLVSRLTQEQFSIPPASTGYCVTLVQGCKQA